MSALEGGFLPPVVADLVLNSSEFSLGLAKANAEMDGFGRNAGGIGRTIASGMALAAGAVAVAGAASVKMAADFQTSMTRIRTQAHDTTDNLKTMGDAVLSLAPKVGFGPTALADALYHVTSVGYRAGDALSILKLAAEGARISGASLDDTTYGLTSTMKSFGDTGVKGATKDMAELNAIVGAGDMKMQDLNDAIQTGLMSTSATFGVSLQSMGTALAFLTDRGEKANVAATRLSMGITLMEVPSAKAQSRLEALHVPLSDITAGTKAMTDALAKTGLTQSQLATDLRKPDGIYVALEDLKTKMTEDGISAQQQGTIIASVFGGARTGKAIMALYDSLDQMPGKFDQIGQGVQRFGQDWADTQKTFSQQMADFNAALDAVGIKIGLFLIPKILDLGRTIGNAWHQWEPIAKAAGASAGKQFLDGFNGQINAPSHFTTPGLQKQSDPRFASGGVSNKPSFLQQLGSDARSVWSTLEQFGREISKNLQPVIHDWAVVIQKDVLPALKNWWGVVRDFAPVLKFLAEVVLAAVIVESRIFGFVLRDVVGPEIRIVSELAKGLADYLTGPFVKAMMSTAGFWQGVWHVIEATAGGAAVGVLTATKDIVDGVLGAIVTLIGFGSHLPSWLGGDKFRAAAKDVKGWKSDFDSSMSGAIKDVQSLMGNTNKLSNALHDVPSPKITITAVDHATSLLDQVKNTIAGLGVPITVQGFSNLSKLTSPQFQADGGLLRGPGGPRDDRIPVMASNGEFVVNAAATAANLPLLQAINARKFANGGLVTLSGTYLNPLIDTTGLSQAVGNLIGAGGNGAAGGATSSGANVALGAKLAATLYGWVGPMFDALNKLWTRESGWNANAVNPSSGAAGIPQALGHGNVFALGDAYSQILWGLSYIAGRYGNPINAWAHEVSAGWYDRGGWLNPGWTMAYNGTGKPERIRTAEQEAALGGGLTINLYAYTVDRNSIYQLADLVLTGISRKKARGDRMPQNLSI